MKNNFSSLFPEYNNLNCSIHKYFLIILILVVVAVVYWSSTEEVKLAESQMAGNFYKKSPEANKTILLFFHHTNALASQPLQLLHFIYTHTQWINFLHQRIYSFMPQWQTNYEQFSHTGKILPVNLIYNPTIALGTNG